MACLISLALVRVLDPFPVQVARNVYFDQLQRLSPRDYVPLPIRVVDIDEASLATLGQWPWRNCPPPAVFVLGRQTLTVLRMVWKMLVPERSLAVSTTVRMSASPSAAHMAR
ncbi:CHASE2 domain-containing protein [Aurantimonas sp. A2-1-M11]|uniref:CHASE2 domain-containing protein n=1 Tax=Aurantimonas sp. A2-1-M11 TaxID=3113712 RepID=UPI003FA523ED